jgi:hypothetical protein
MNIELLIEILDKGIEKHGEKPLTNVWLRNILAMYNEIESSYNLAEDVDMSDLF